MTFEKTGRLPGLREPTPKEQEIIMMIRRTIDGYLADVPDLIRKAVVTNLLSDYGSLEQLSASQQAVYRRKRPPSRKGWRG